MAGYSTRTLVDKLGIKPGMKIAIVNAPENYADTLGPVPDGVTQFATVRGQLNFIHFFTKSRAEYESQLLALKAHLVQNGMIWISWPKGASKVPTDMNERKHRARFCSGQWIGRYQSRSHRCDMAGAEVGDSGGVA